MGAPGENMTEIVDGTAAVFTGLVAARPPEPAAPPAGPDPPTTLRLNHQVKGWLGARVGRPRTWGFHPSEMKGLCPVFHYYIEEARNNVASPVAEVVQQAFGFLRTAIDARTRSFNPGVQMELREGDYIHDDARFYLGILGYLVGRWRCSFCFAETTVELAQMPRIEVPDLDGRPTWDAAPCSRCVGRNLRDDISWYYIEPYVYLPEWEIDGHVDGILHIPFEDGSFVPIVLEIKSINEAGYQQKYGTIPKPEHIEQASLYAWAWGISHLCFLYINKNQVQQWKEFVVRRDEAAIQDAQEKILAVKTGRLRGEAPTWARACKDIREERAVSCPAVERCFGCKPPANFMELP